jgi:hypothetical protein
MKIVAAGCSGMLGTPWVDQMRTAGHEVVLLSRSGKGGVQWDGRTLGDWAKELRTAGAVVNLSGSTIQQRWNEAGRKSILDSRVDSTRVIAQALREGPTTVRTWINASAVGYYGNDFVNLKDESSPPGTGFLADVSVAWERELFAPDLPEIRRVALRTGVVLGREGGAFPVWKKLTKFFLGGQVADGKTPIPWIHEADWLGIANHVLASDSAEGPWNLVGPESNTNAEVMAAMREALHRPWSPPAPKIGIKLVERVFGVPSALSLEGARVVPKAANDAGYKFQFPTLESALTNLC